MKVRRSGTERKKVGGVQGNKQTKTKKISYLSYCWDRPNFVTLVRNIYIISDNVVGSERFPFYSTARTKAVYSTVNCFCRNISIYMSTCRAPHLEMSPKRFTMATTALCSASEQNKYALVVCDSEYPPQWLQRCFNCYNASCAT